MTHNPSVTFSSAVGETDQQFIDILFEHYVMKEGLGFRQCLSRTLTADATTDMPTEWVKMAEVNFERYKSILYRHTLTGALLTFGLTPEMKSASFTIAARTAEERDGITKQLLALKPARQIPPDKEEVFVNFWSLAPNGARGMERTITINPWAKIADNYAPNTTTGLAKLMTDFKPSKAGQLILWYGPPGTGKTHALRALAWEWRKWCTYHYITDPEVFFGGNANYMLDVLLTRGQGPTDINDDEDSVSDEQAKRKWRLLILEDSGELMVPDAKTQTGQGLSRLLNVVDGLIGQGLRIMVLVTTNEILKKLHPAVARPGRCAARIEFNEFTKAEAGLWLANRGYDCASNEFGLQSALSLADLYSHIGDEQTIVETHRMPVGFNS